ncbi:MAG: hypothetical protein ACR2JC_14455 [Chloroflexota bacterium]|nr:MAG: hypothetical protein DLM70_06005 [Chloroflexota bacterium]
MIRDQERFRRHKGACPYYRENWVPGEQLTEHGETLLYEVYCLKGWPAESTEEQDQCMGSVRCCWRNGESHRVTPEESAALRTEESA